jgi:hypothetical protein
MKWRVKTMQGADALEHFLNKDPEPGWKLHSIMDGSTEEDFCYTVVLCQEEPE